MCFETYYIVASLPRGRARVDPCPYIVVVSSAHVLAARHEGLNRGLLWKDLVNTRVVVCMPVDSRPGGNR